MDFKFSNLHEKKFYERKKLSPIKALYNFVTSHKNQRSHNDELTVKNAASENNDWTFVTNVAGLVLLGREIS